MIYLKNSESTQEVFIPKMGSTRPTYTRGYNDGYNEGIKHQKSLLEPLFVTSNGVYETDNGFSEVTVNVQKSDDVVTKPLNVQPTITDVEDNELVYNPLEYDADAFNIVNINVSNLKEGYKEEQKALLEDLNVTENGTYTNENGYKSVNVNVEQSYNLEDKIISPQTNEVDGSGYIYIRPNEGYDGMREVALQTGQLKIGWYNEGYEQGKSEGGECNLEEIINTPQISEVNEGYLYYNPSEGYNGLSRVVIQTGDLRNAWYNEGYNEGVEQGGGGSELVLGHQLEEINSNGRHTFYPQNNGWNGFDLFEVEVDVPTTAKLQDVWVEPTMADVDGNNLLVYAPNIDEGYDGLSRVVVNPSNIYNEGKDSIKEFKYNPLTVEDVSFGERATNFSIVPQTLWNDETDSYLTDTEKVYLPTYDNKNQIRTSKIVDTIIGFPFEDADKQYISLIKIGSGVKRFVVDNLNMSELATIIVGEDTIEFNTQYCNFPKLHTIIARGLVDIILTQGTVADNGTLWVDENNTNADSLLSSLPSGWTKQIITNEMNILL